MKFKFFCMECREVREVDTQDNNLLGLYIGLEFECPVCKKEYRIEVNSMEDGEQ